jgi:DNA (cytosine-5)-methyltransferase 3A
MNVLSLFDGISCGMVALERAGVKVDNYFASEIDKDSIAISASNYPHIIRIGDVLEIDFAKLPPIDVLIGGSPCQDLSVLKIDGEGLDGEKSKLFYEYIKAKNICNPKWFLLENVVPRKKEWTEIISREVGALPIKINSDLFVQQNRPRLYWTNIPIHELPSRPDWNGSFWRKRGNRGWRKNKSGVCFCLTAGMGTGGGSFIKKSMNDEDELSMCEIEKLQGLPCGYTSALKSKYKRMKSIGNGWTIDVLAHIFKGLND